MPVGDCTGRECTDSVDEEHIDTSYVGPCGMMCRRASLSIVTMLPY